MQELNPKEIFKKVLHHKKVEEVPVCSATQTGILELMELSGAFWPEANYNAEKMASLALAGHELAGFENVRVPFCCTVLAETLGCTVAKGAVDMQPYVIDFPYKEKKDLRQLKLPENLLESPRTTPVLNAVELLQEKVGEEIPVLAGVVGPAGLSLMLAGIRNYLMWFMTSPESVETLLESCTEACIEYANALLARGADAIVLIDSEAGPDILAPEMLKTSILPKYQKICKKIEGPKILHMCGDASAVLSPLSKVGFEGISIEEKVSVRAAREIVGNRVALIGNVSPSDTLLTKGPVLIKKEAKACLADGIDILAPGCGLAPMTPLKNVKALVEARDEYYIEPTPQKQT